MKTETEIREKFALLFDRRLKARMKFRLSRNYHNCSHVATSGRFHVCSLRGEGDVKVCDDKVCESCGRYECGYDAESVREEFVEVLSDPSTCFQQEPKLAMLIWVLKDDAFHDVEDVSVFKRIARSLNPLRWFRRK